MAPGWKKRQTKREAEAAAAERIDPVSEVALILIDLGWVASGKTTAEVVRFPAAEGGHRDALFGSRRRFTLPRTPRICTVGGRTTCFYRLGGDLAPIDFLTVRTKDLDEVRRIALGTEVHA